MSSFTNNFGVIPAPPKAYLSAEWTYLLAGDLGLEQRLFLQSEWGAGA
jgi:hypothetical protein